MNPLKYLRIWNSEDCPCGGGSTYARCCKNKGIIPQQASKKPPEVQVMEMMRKSMAKCCMHPDKQNCRGQIKGAHALQNNKIISLLAGDERHVYMLDAKKQPLLIPMDDGNTEMIVEISRTSANDATTETCFCDLHDNIAFAVIEKGAPDFDESNEEMKFIYAYKAFIFEYYKQRIAMDIFRASFAKQPGAFKPLSMIRVYRMLQLKMREFEPVKDHFDRQILSGQHGGIETCVVKLPEQIRFAVYAYIAPDHDMEGNRIRHTVKNVMNRLAVTAFPEQSQSYILLSCLQSDKRIYEGLFKQLQSSPPDRIKFYLSIMLPLYSENMVLSPVLWESWADETKMAYTFYANLQGPTAAVYSKGIGMLLRNAARTSCDYSKRSKIDLFI